MPLTILQVLHLGFRALDEFYRLHNYYPSPGSADDAAEVLNMVKSWSSPKSEGDMDIDGFFVDSSVVEAEQKSISWLSMGSRASLSPMAAAFGGIVGQEVLKAASGKFSPITQWLYFDAVECLPEEPLEQTMYSPVGSRYDDQISVFGSVAHEELRSMSYFLVGAGAIGYIFLRLFSPSCFAQV